MRELTLFIYLIPINRVYLLQFYLHSFVRKYVNKQCNCRARAANIILWNRSAKGHSHKHTLIHILDRVESNQRPISSTNLNSKLARNTISKVYNFSIPSMLMDANAFSQVLRVHSFHAFPFYICWTYNYISPSFVFVFSDGTDNIVCSCS